ncbi:MAG TPA: response regulator [Nannocystaceae bacterium]|nr:response regulator [Nannocystaceae bacterium]
MRWARELHSWSRMTSAIIERLSLHGRVLLAEDDAELRGLLASVLRKQGFEVIEVEDGRRLLGHLARCVPYGPHQSPDVIVSDVRMPGSSGLAILRGLAASTSRVPMVLMTAFPEEEMRARALGHGAVALLDKPLDLEELLRVVARSIFRRPAWA